MPFFLKVHADKQQFAERHGLQGTEWRSQLIEDLLHDGELEVSAGQNDEGSVFDLHGRRVRVRTVQDKYRPDTLFVLSINAGPARGARLPPDAVRVSGPWELLPDSAHTKRVAFPVAEHINAYIVQERREQARHLRDLSAEGARGFGIMAAALKKMAIPPASGGPSSDDPPSPAQPESANVEDVDRPNDARVHQDTTDLGIEPAPSPPDTSDPLPQYSPKLARRSGGASALESASSLDSHGPDVASLLTSSNPRKALLTERQALAAKISSLQERMSNLPSEDELDDTLKAMERVSVLAKELCLSLEPASPATMSQLGRIAGLLEAMASPLWQRLPKWVAPDGSARAELLGDCSVSGQLEEALDWINGEFGDSLPSVLSELEPAPGDTLLEKLRGAWACHLRRAQITERIAPLSPNSMILGLSDNETQSLVIRVERLRDVLHPAALAEFWEILPGLGIDEWLKLSEPVLRTTLPQTVLAAVPEWTAVHALLSHIDARTSQTKVPANAGASPLGPARREWFQGFDHPTTTAGDCVRVHANTVRVQLPESRETTSIIRLAVRIKLRSPIRSAAQLFVRAEQIKALPTQPITTTARIIEDPVVDPKSGTAHRCLLMDVPSGPWDSHADGVYLDLVVPLPAHRGTLERLLSSRSEMKILLELVVVDGKFSGSLSYSRFAEGVPSFTIPEEDQTPLEVMKLSPLGVQPGYEELDLYVRQATKSFQVSAPRRFGKSTLLRYLEAVASENAESFVCRTTLNRNDSPNRSLTTVLSELQDEFRKRLDIEVQFHPSRDGHLDRGTFQAARQVLAQRGFKNFVVLIDEAQSLVPRSDGGMWGTRLKDLIENHLATQSPNLARVCIVMTGTPQLPRRLGANCQAFMSVMAERTSFGEEELGRFIRRISAGALESSAQARERLATIASNLYTLKALLREVVQIALAEGRTFFVSGDVELASERLLERDRSSGGSLWNYVAAELSHTDEWDPIDAYPVALALAAVGQEARGAGTIQNALSWLDGQLDRCDIQASVTEERVRDGIQDLKRLGILAPDTSFRRPLLACLLRQRLEMSPFHYNLDQIALARLAVDVIEWDSRLVPQGGGGQAEVYVLDRDGIGQAWRACRLDNDGERRRFVRTCAAIQVLRDARTRLDGDLHLPRVRRAGFDLDDPTRGIVIYDWVNGEEYGPEWEVSSVAARLHVGLQIAMALEALQARGVVHRDVHPRNIIVNGELKAVLIDFGMACLATETRYSTVSEHNFLAPELLNGACATYASDMFALGKIIRGPKGDDYDVESEIGRLVRSLTHPAPTERPTAVHVVCALRALRSSEPFNAPLEKAREARDSVLLEAMEIEWLYGALEPHGDEAAFRVAGLRHWTPQAAMATAACLNGVFEAWIGAGQDEEARALAGKPWKNPSASLSAVRQIANQDVTMAEWRSEYVGCVGALRNAWAHPADREQNLERARKHQRNRAPLQVYREALQQTAQLLDMKIGAGDVVSRFVRMLTAGMA